MIKLIVIVKGIVVLISNSSRNSKRNYRNTSNGHKSSHSNFTSNRLLEREDGRPASGTCRLTWEIYMMGIMLISKTLLDPGIL